MDAYRWFASHPFTGRVLGGEFSLLPTPYERRPESFSDWDCFVSVNRCMPTARVKASDSDIATITNILVDLDPINDLPLPASDHLAAIEMAQYSISQCLGYHAFAVSNFSGRGLQLLLGVSQYSVPTVALRQDWRNSVKSFLIALAKDFDPRNGFGLRVDTCTSDLSRLCRATGTINQSTKLMAHNIFSNDGTLIDPFHFLSLYRMAMPEKNIESRSALAHPKSCWVVFPRLTVSARRFISEGACYGQRNDACYKAAISCLENGISKADTMMMLQKGNRLSSPMLEQHELSTILNNALRRYSQENPDCLSKNSNSQPLKNHSNESVSMDHPKQERLV